MLLPMAKISFFFIAEYCSIVCMYHICSVHSSADGQLGCFHALATVNHAAMNIRIHVSFHIELLGFFLVFFLDIYQGVEFLGHVVALILGF